MIKCYLRKTKMLLAVFLLAPLLALAQCPPGSFALTTQEQINLFAIAYPDCTEVAGALLIGGDNPTDISDLTPLSNLSVINGQLQVSNTSLTSLAGLGNVTTVAGNIVIRQNASLTSTGGLNSLTNIGGSMEISQNPVLVNLNGLTGITGLNGSLLVQINASLQNITGLSGLTSVGGSFHISRNGALQNVNGLNSLISIGGNFLIDENVALTNVDGLNGLTQIGQTLQVSKNTMLTNLDGLSNMTSLGAGLTILDNSALTDISGLGAIDPTAIISLSIANNAQLAVCNLPNICEYLAGSGNRIITGNAAECVDEAAIVATCTPAPECPPGDVTIASQEDMDQFAVDYPNCTQINGNLKLTGGVSDVSALSNIVTITGGFSIEYSALTNIDGLSNLNSIGLDIFLYRCSSLTNVDGLSGLNSIGTEILILECHGLTNLNGLSNLTSMNGYLGIDYNQSLTDISGLQSINPAGIDTLAVTNNPLLTLCNLPNFCEYLTGSGARTIIGNAGDCLNEAAVATACTPAPACPPSHVVLYTQAEVDQFAIDYPNCTELPGNLRLFNGDINDLGAFSNITKITGHLTLQDLTVSNLSGFNNLTVLGADLIVDNCDMLVNIDDLSNITSIAARVEFANNNALQNIDALTGITAVGQNLIVRNNPNLTSLDGLTNVASISSSLTLNNNDGLTNLDGLQSLVSIGGGILIEGNDTLTNIDALEGVTSIGTNLTVRGNASLPNVNGLASLATMGGILTIENNIVLADISGLESINPAGITNLKIVNNPQLSVCNLPNFCEHLNDSGNREISGNTGECVNEAAVVAACTPAPDCPPGNLWALSQAELDQFAIDYPNCTQINGSIYTQDLTDLTPLQNIVSITGTLELLWNPDLTSLSGLENLQSVGGGLAIYQNASLTSLEGLNNLTSVGGNVQIGAGPLESLSGLSGLSTVGGSFSVFNQPILTDLEGLENLSSVGSAVYITGNQALVNVDALSNLTSMAGLLSIENNAALTDISGLQSIDVSTMTYLRIVDNPALAVCDLPNFCTYLVNPTGTHARAISGNLAECVNEAAVVNACSQVGEFQTQLVSSRCGGSVALIGDTIKANPVVGATGYRFKVTDLTSEEVQILDRTVANFKLTQLPVFNYSRTYSVQIELAMNGNWVGYYGPACTISSPYIESDGQGQIFASYCGQRLATVSTLISTTSLPNAGTYRFRVTDLTNSDGPHAVQILDRGLQWFSLTMLERYNYGSAYQIEVAVRTTTGSFTPYGPPCTVYTPAVPELNGCGSIIPTATTMVSTASLLGVTTYRFEVTNTQTLETQNIDRPLQWFRMNMIENLEPSTDYMVRVAVMTTGEFSPFSNGCIITSPGAAREDVKQSAVAFDAVAYPNPFADTFGISLSTSDEADVTIKTYDMTGRMLENKTVPATEMETVQIGERFPAGVYNVVITQGDRASTLRVIKR
jgi:hypothetical protein